ncbi:hypothetical protein OVN20_07695 [Microcella daejeonensis]|uniref:VOC family protein n=1 Tax=Microcella daejeonensis TaxID=2994971 RepID=UPI00226F3CC2|nr:VOC family protein [Microcella daejeonensis]WAB82993.1 hypothetical protein OVN20_07695 [Microcella daejeonensis]
MVRAEIVEIPVADLVQAAAFYSAVFDVDLVIETIGGLTMAFFPDEPGATGGAVALCAGDGYRPSGLGVRTFLRIDDVDAALARALEAGAQLVAEPVEMPGWGASPSSAIPRARSSASCSSSSPRPERPGRAPRGTARQESMRLRRSGCRCAGIPNPDLG